MRTGNNHVGSSENLSDHLNSGARPDLGDWTFEGISGGAFFDDLDPGFHPDDQDSGGLDLGVHQGDFQISHHASQAFGSPSQSRIPYVKKGRRQKNVTENITEDDFNEGAERNAFLMVMHFAHKLLHKKSTPKATREGLAFFFADDLDPEAISFELCANVLAIRPDIIRLRIQYEWWMRGTVFTGPFDFATVGMPKLLEGEILYHSLSLGHALTREVWVQPGISTEELFEYIGTTVNCSTSKMVEAMDSLSENFILSKSSGWYLTGRNPMLMNMNSSAFQPSAKVSGGSVHWTRLFAMTN
jgi:hypothetical protein